MYTGCPLVANVVGKPHKLQTYQIARFFGVLFRVIWFLLLFPTHETRSISKGETHRNKYLSAGG